MNKRRISAMVFSLAALMLAACGLDQSAEQESSSEVKYPARVVENRTPRLQQSGKNNRMRFFKKHLGSIDSEPQKRGGKRWLLH